MYGRYRPGSGTHSVLGREDASVPRNPDRRKNARSRKIRQTRRKIMGNLISFVNAFLSYIMLLLVIAVVGGAAITIGLTLAKKKSARTAQEEAAADSVNG